MLRNLSVATALLLVVAIAGPAMASTNTLAVTFTGTFTNALDDNNYFEAGNWSWDANTPASIPANGPVYNRDWGDNGDGAPYENLVFGAGQAGPGNTWQTTSFVDPTLNPYPEFDIITFTGNNDFTVGGTYTYGSPVVVNLLTAHTFSMDIGNQRLGGAGPGPDGTYGLTINAVAGSTLNATGFDGRPSYGPAGTGFTTTINGGGTVNFTQLSYCEAKYGQYLSIQLNNNSTVNLNDAELENLSGTGTLNFAANPGDNTDYTNFYLDNAANFQGTVSFTQGGAYINGNMTNLNVVIGDTKTAVTFNGTGSGATGTPAVMIGGGISGGGHTIPANHSPGNWMNGSVFVPNGLTMLGSTIQPSSSNSAAGVIQIAAANVWPEPPVALTLGKNGTTNCQLSIAVVGTNQVAGTDFSQLAVEGYIQSVSNPANALADTNLVVSIKPGMTPVGTNGTNLGNSALYLQTLTILSNDIPQNGSDGQWPLQDYTGAGFANLKFNGGFATVAYGPGGVTLTGIFSNPTLAGDANNDGQVNGADYAFWAANYGANNATWLQGDFNNDGQVNGADYAIWAANYGTGSGTSATPEPISMIILAIGGGLVALKRRNA